MSAKKLAVLNTAAAAGATPTAAQAPGSAAILADHGMHGEDWIARQAPDHYTLQVMSSGNEAALAALLEREQLSGEVAYFKVIADGKPRYTAIYGVFATQAQAEAARAQLPPTLQAANPWVRKLGDVQKLLPQQPAP
jgi:septal ring-binding cell division protein DamX